MKVLGIDPGTAACGYGIVHESDGRLRAIDHGWWRTRAGERPEARLKTIFDGVADLVERDGEEDGLAEILAELLAHCRLSDVQPLCGAPEVKLLGDGDEVTKQSQLHGWNDMHAVLVAA